MPERVSDDAVVRVVDTPTQRVHHPSDLVGVVVSALGVALVLLMTVYAHATTQGVAEDVHGFAHLLARVLVVPVAVLESLVTVFIPIAVVTELALRRLGRQILESVAAAALGLALVGFAHAVITGLGSDELVSGLSVRVDGNLDVVMPGYVAAIAALLTVAGPRTRRRTVKWSWNLLWIALGVVLITAQISLPGALITLLLGRMAGDGVRYLSGVRSERAYGPDLIDGVRRAGFEPTYLVRVRDVADPTSALQDQHVTSVSSAGQVTGEVQVRDLRTGEHPTISRVDRPAEAIVATWDPAAVALTRAGDNRVYALFTPDQVRRDVVVLDGDRQVVGFLARSWRTLRLRGLDTRAAVSLRAAAERAALLSYAASAAGVRNPKLLGVAESEDSMLLVQEHAGGTVSLRDASAEVLDDDVLHEAWAQLRRAHAAGLTHRALTSDVVLVASAPGPRPRVWLTGWESGDVASNELARRLDLAQLLAVLALRVGPERAVTSASKALPDHDLESIGPVLQSIALPAATREEVRADKQLLKQLRAALVDRLPAANLEPENITRFSARTVLTISLTIVAVVAIVGTINADEITSAFSAANPWWAVATFVVAILSWVGATITLIAFAPVVLPWVRTFLTQIAGSFVALAAPAGLGPAALNLRMLTKRGVTTSLGLATVALVQVAQFVVTILILLVLSIASGDGSGLVSLPSTTVMLAIGGLAIVLASTLLVPSVRRWVLARIQPTMQQVWPRLSEMLGRPQRLAAGLGGSLLLSLSYVLSFDAALNAFGQHLNIIDVAVIYLVGNAAGAAVPTPGGIGAIEAALILGLTTAGVSAPIATSVVVLFRVATYWARIPIGWVVMRWLQRQGDL
jgi:uncharacterized membrane protein YbhN (UPF0104 family)